MRIGDLGVSQGSRELRDGSLASSSSPFFFFSFSSCFTTAGGSSFPSPSLFLPSSPHCLISFLPPSIETLESKGALDSKGSGPETLPLGTKSTILVSEKLGEVRLELLQSFDNIDCSYNLSPEELCSKISLRDALIVERTGVGIDNVDLQAAMEFSCLVVNAPTANTFAAAEHGIALLAAMAKIVAQANASMKAESDLRIH